MIRPDFPARTVLVIPALNETGCVGATVARWRRLGFDCIRVVDNGSTDDTAAEARTAGAEVLHEPQRGYGAAAWRGLQHWPEDRTWVLFSSADGSDQLSEADLTVWQQTLDSGADLVLGDRTASDAARRHLKWIQRFGNQVQCSALAWGWGHRFRDMGSLRLVRRTALDPMRLADRAFGWNLEMQVRAVELHLRCVELPVEYYPRTAGESKISGSWSGSWRAGCGILKMLAHLWRLRRTPLAPLAPERVASGLSACP